MHLAAEGERAPRTVWFICDDKPGHRSQLQGLERALQQCCRLAVHWFSLAEAARLRRALYTGADKPDWVVGAGHRTHSWLLLLAWRYRARAIVLMKPSLPQCLFDVIVAPQHDGLRESRRVINSVGALNPIALAQHRDPARGLLLIGGPSKHHDWEDSALLQQLAVVLEREANRQWVLTTSRRTPASFLAALRQRPFANLQIVPVEQTAAGWVAEQLSRAHTVWVSEDSVSMIFEALTAGAQVGLLSVPRRQVGRITDGIDQLLKQQRVSSFADYRERGYSAQQCPPLREADRVAALLLARLAPKGRA